MSEPKYKPGDHVTFTMKFGAEGIQPVLTSGDVIESEGTPEGYYRVRTNFGIAILLPEEELSSG